MDAQHRDESSQDQGTAVDKIRRGGVARLPIARMRRAMAEVERKGGTTGALPEDGIAREEGAREGREKQGGEIRLLAVPVEGRGTGRALTVRSIIVGLLLVGFVAAFTPYNDRVLHNSPFIGNHLPSGIFTLMAVLVVVVNPGLMWLGKLMRKGRGEEKRGARGAWVKPFSPGELVVIMTLMLVGAAVPSSGLMRYLEPMVVTPFWHLRQFSWLKEAWTNLLPSGLFPSTDSNASIIANYWLGIDPLRGGSVPWMAFAVPALLWGVLIAALLGAALFLAAIFRKQWVHHERLSFPLATLPLELVAAPEPGRFLNGLCRNPLLWVGAGIPFLVYFLAGLHSYFPAVPQIDLHFHLRDAFTDRPWDALPSHIVDAQLYFAAVGICFFVPSEVALSLWLFVVVNGFARVFFARTSFDPQEHETTRAMGIYVAYFAGLLWLARGHLRHVMVAAWKKMPRAEDEPLAYRTMVIGWLVCMGVAWVWLMLVGMSWLMAGLLLFLGTMMVTLMSRIVAETGLFYVNVGFWPKDVFMTLLGRGAVSGKSFLWSEIISGIFYADFRENLMPYATNAMRMGQEIKPAKARSKWFVWLGAALLLSTLVSGAMNHYLSYTYGRSALDDNYASFTVPYNAMKETYEHLQPGGDSGALGTAWGHFGVGAAMAVVLMAGRMMWASWPFHPIGLVLMDSSAMKVLWFSIFIGWGAKRLLLRYGGAGAFRRARPFFIGLILGEVLSAGIWMFVGLATNGAVRYSLMPG